jgi:lipid II:glycine glycyltransferase (peptidoglycan interpeptide bridge formation enzyme)
MHEFHLGVPGSDWDDNQIKLKAHMLQGRPWSCFQQAYGRQVVWCQSENWSWMAVVVKGRGVRYLYVPYGPTVINKTGFSEAMSSLKLAAESLNLDFVRVEPIGIEEEEIMKTKLRKIKSVQPQETLIVYLKQDTEILRSQLSSSHRNTINGSERRGLKMRSSTNMKDFAVFIDLMHKTAETRGFHAYPDDYYKILAETLMPLGKAKFFIAEHEGKAVSASLCMDYQKTRAYSYTGNDPNSRNLRATAPLVWKIILDSRTEGFDFLDLWGIAPISAGKDHPWAGFSEFKRSFGGKEVFYSGTWELPIHLLKYNAHRLAKKLTK